MFSLPQFDPLATPDTLVIAIVAFIAGVIRGFTGFGGPAFMLAILTMFYAPIVIIAKVLIVDFGTGCYLFKQVCVDVNWRRTLTLFIPTLLAMPLGHFLLFNVDAETMKRAIALIIAFTCVLMLSGVRYKATLTTPLLIVVGILAGIVFGATYIALVCVVAILLGPDDKNSGRTLIIAWAFLTSIAYLLVSINSGATGWSDISSALPGVVTYWFGAQVGSRGFRKSSEHRYRQIAVCTLLAITVFSFIA